MNHRIHQLQKCIRQKNLGALLISSKVNVYYLCGFKGTSGTLLVTPKKAVLITDARYFVTAKTLKLAYYDYKEGLKKLLSRYKTIGFESEHITVGRLKKLKKVVPGVKWQAISGMVEELRIVKEISEIRIIRRAAFIACKILNEFKKKIKVGKSEDELEWELLVLTRKYGAEGFSFPPIITFGGQRADIHHQKGEAKLKKGEPVLIDFGITYQGYITDMTRVFYLSKPTKLEQKIYSIVLEANQKAIESIRVGKKLSDVDKTARRVIEEAGYGEYFSHSTGHGTGIEVHEAPHVSVKSKDVVKPGMVFTIEPGIYIEGKGGVRIEDMVYVTKSGQIEVLTVFPK